MIRPLAKGVAVIATIMTTAIPLFVFAQTTESDIEPMLPTSKQVVADPDATNGDNDLNTDASVQDITPANPAISAEVDVEIQSRLNEIRRELLDDRANTIDWWLAVTALVLTFFGIVVALAGFLGFRRFREIMNEAQEGAKAAAKHAEDAERHVTEIKKNRDKSREILGGLNAQVADDNPEQASQAVEDVQNNPQASLMDKAVATAVAFQRRGDTEKAVEKWQAIANIAEESDNDLAAKAWHSIGYLIRNASSEKCISACDQAIRLNPDNASSYNNRGSAKARSGQYEAAIPDYDEAIRLSPDNASFYNNRGSAKARSGQYEAAIPDHDEAIRLNPDHSIAYFTRGIAWLLREEYDKAKSDLYDAKNRGIDISVEFRSEYNSVADFENQYGINVPEYIKTILEPQQGLSG